MRRGELPWKAADDRSDNGEIPAMVKYWENSLGMRPTIVVTAGRDCRRQNNRVYCPCPASQQECHQQRRRKEVEHMMASNNTRMSTSESQLSRHFIGVVVALFDYAHQLFA